MPVGNECTNTYQQPDDKETKQFWSKISERREQNRKAEWISNMGRELKGLEEVFYTTRIHIQI